MHMIIFIFTRVPLLCLSLSDSCVFIYLFLHYFCNYTTSKSAISVLLEQKMERLVELQAVLCLKLFTCTDRNFRKNIIVRNSANLRLGKRIDQISV